MGHIENTQKNKTKQRGLKQFVRTPRDVKLQTNVQYDCDNLPS